MLIYVKKKNNFLRTDGQTDGRTTQNYSSEPHKTSFSLYHVCQKKIIFIFIIIFNFILSDKNDLMY